MWDPSASGSEGRQFGAGVTGKRREDMGAGLGWLMRAGGLGTLAGWAAWLARLERKGERAKLMWPGRKERGEGRRPVGRVRERAGIREKSGLEIRLGLSFSIPFPIFYSIPLVSNLSKIKSNKAKQKPKQNHINPTCLFPARMHSNK